MTKRSGYLLLVAFFLLALDFFSKMWVVEIFCGKMGVFHDVCGIDFCLERVTNRGGAWGIFASSPYVLLTLRLIIFSGLLLYVLVGRRNQGGNISFVLLLTGAFGNVLDFFCYGHVIDFLHFTFWGVAFPVFNFADVMIFFGVTLQLVQPLRKRHGTPPVSSRSTPS